MKPLIAFPDTQAAFRGTNGFITSPFPYESYPWIASQLRPRNDDPARFEAAGGRSRRWQNKGALPSLFQASPKTRVFRSKLFQTNLWRFCGISRGYKVSKRPLMLSKFFACSRPLLAAFCLILRCGSVDGAFIAEQRPRSREF